MVLVSPSTVHEAVSSAVRPVGVTRLKSSSRSRVMAFALVLKVPLSRRSSTRAIDIARVADRRFETAVTAVIAAPEWVGSANGDAPYDAGRGRLREGSRGFGPSEDAMDSRLRLQPGRAADVE